MNSSRGMGGGFGWGRETIAASIMEEKRASA
jgi:hypothetical protein